MNARQRMCGLLFTLPLVAAGALAPDLSASADEFEKATDGISVYLGVVPCDALQAVPRTQDETKMHGGIPAIQQCHHVMVALFDESSGARIEDATVSAAVGEFGMYAESKPLERMTDNGTITYGNYFQIPQKRMYRIDLRIHRNGLSHVSQAAFDYEDQTR